MEQELLQPSLGEGALTVEQVQTWRWIRRIAYGVYYLICYYLIINEYHLHTLMNTGFRSLFWGVLGWFVWGNVTTYCISKGGTAIYG